MREVRSTGIKLWIGFGLLALTILSGCQFHSAPPKKANPPAPAVNSKPLTAKPISERDSDRSIARLLAEADYALSQDRLLMPIEDNAFDRYQSVLLLDPNNQQARTGLQALGLRYVEMTRSSLNRGQLSQARSHLNNARGIDPNNPLLDDLEKTLRRAQAAQPPARAYQPKANEHLLDAQGLTKKSPQVVARLRQLARKARETGDMVVIYARNDAEGRWIYSQMREALEDFLLRGDIKIATQPRIQFTPIL